MNENKNLKQEEKNRAKLWRSQNDFTDFLRGEIMSGRILPGEQLMSPLEMSRVFHVNILKVNSTLSKLKKEKLIVSFPKKGFFVSGYRYRKVSEHIIGVVSNGGAEDPLRRMFNRMESVLNENGYDMIVRNSGNSQSKEEKIIRSFLASHVDGIIVDPSSSQILCRHMELYRRLDQQQIPYVFINSAYPQMINKPRIAVNDQKGGYLLTRHLIATGRKNIVGIFRSDDYRGSERHKGYVTALQEAGIPYRPELVIWFQSVEKNKKALVILDSILLSDKCCDGIVCYNDSMARSVMYYLFSKGYRVPEDIGVVGYGNSDSPAAGELGITTIAEPNALLGELASELILGKINYNQPVPDRDIQLLEPDLVIRSTSVSSAV